MAQYDEEIMTIEITDEHRSILKTLLYYQIFRFPLRLDELHRFSSYGYNGRGSVDESVDQLVEWGLVRRHEEWVFLGETKDIKERCNAERLAEKVMPRALRRSRFIARFPFVRGVALSGTLSKGIFDKGDDVDFFVITARDRLWICRTLLMTFKKAFLLNSKRTFCINYFITEDNLVIPNQNRFTAAEIAWLKPTVNAQLFSDFFASNNWTRLCLPNWRPVNVNEASDLPTKRSFAEWIFSGPLGARIDDRCREAIVARNRRKYKELNSSQFNNALRASSKVSKHHPRSLEEKILQQFSDKVLAFEKDHNVDLGL